MRKILDAWFEGSLLVEPLTEKRSPEHQKASDTAFGLLDELSKKLNEEEKKMLDKAIDALTLESDYFAEDRFSRGYCLGAFMMLEVMEKREDFFFSQQG